MLGSTEHQRRIDAAKGKVIGHREFGINGAALAHEIIKLGACRIRI